MIPLLIGTRGWAHADWRSRFYPDELPDDWRFCFYSNRLRSVLVPAEAWADANADTLAGWRDDSDPEFRFVVELPSALYEGEIASFSAFLRRLEPIAAQLAGVLVRPPPVIEPALLAGLFAALAPLPLCLDVRGPVSEEVERLCAHYAVGRYWDAEQGGAPAPGGRLCVAVARAGEPRYLRELIEALSRWRREDAIAGLFFDHPYEGARLAEQARTLAEFMGV